MQFPNLFSGAESAEAEYLAFILNAHYGVFCEGG